MPRRRDTPAAYRRLWQTAHGQLPCFLYRERRPLNGYSGTCCDGGNLHILN